MEIEQLIEFLDDVGLAYKENDRSIIFSYCSSCGDEDNKVYFYKETLWGKCMKCDNSLHVRRYLRDLGFKLPKGNDRYVKPQGMFMMDLDASKKDPVVAAVEEPVFDAVEFVYVEEAKNTAVVAYAKKRGYVPQLSHQIRVCPREAAVVFLVWVEEKLLGYQKRFVTPISPKMKTKTASGFKAHNHVLRFAREGAEACICEGPFTALSAWHYGFDAYCTFGSGVTDVQVDKILALNSGARVGIAAEVGDSAGIKGYEWLRRALALRGRDSVKVLPESGDDLNDSWQAGKGYRIETDDRDMTYSPLILKGFL